MEPYYLGKYVWYIESKDRVERYFDERKKYSCNDPQGFNGLNQHGIGFVVAGGGELFHYILQCIKSDKERKNVRKKGFSKKTINTYKLEIRVVCREFLAFIVFFRKKSDNYLCLCIILNLYVKTGFSVHNIHLYLCLQVENTKLCCRKMVLNVHY